MKISAGCVIFFSLFGVDNSSNALPESAQKLTLRQAFQVSEVEKHWYSDLSAAKAQSVKTGLPMVLHFEATWCGACKTMSQQVLSKPKVVDRLGRDVIGVKIDADQSPSLIRKFHVAVLPCDVFLDSSGRILAKESGYREMTAYSAAIDSASAAGGGLNWLHNPNIKLGREALAKADGDKNCVITRRSGVIVGLGGYSPVHMIESRKWVKGNRNYAAVYQGVLYYMRDADELKRFQSAPDKFAPKLHGCDPVVLNSLGTPLPGIITLGAVVDGDLYFFASETSRELFKKNPDQFTKVDQRVRGEELQAAGACCTN